MTKMLDRLRKLMDPKTTEGDLDAEDRRLIEKILAEADPRSGEPAATIAKTDPAKQGEGTDMDETKLAEALAKAMEPTLTKVNDRLDAVEKALEKAPAAKAEEAAPTVESVEKALDDMAEAFVGKFGDLQKSLDALTAGASTQEPARGGEPLKKASANPLTGIL